MAATPFFGVHRADEYECCGLRMRDSVAFDGHPPAGCGIEQYVDEMVGEQVDLVDVQHAAVGLGEQTRGEIGTAFAQYARQIERTDDAVPGGTDRQFHHPTAGDRSEAAHDGRLGGPFAPDQHAADARGDGAENQRQRVGLPTTAVNG